MQPPLTTFDHTVASDISASFSRLSYGPDYPAITHTTWEILQDAALPPYLPDLFLSKSGWFDVNPWTIRDAVQESGNEIGGPRFIPGSNIPVLPQMKKTATRRRPTYRFSWGESPSLKDEGIAQAFEFAKARAKKILDAHWDATEAAKARDESSAVSTQRSLLPSHEYPVLPRHPPLEVSAPTTPAKRTRQLSASLQFVPATPSPSSKRHRALSISHQANYDQKPTTSASATAIDLSPLQKCSSSLLAVPSCAAAILDDTTVHMPLRVFNNLLALQHDLESRNERLRGELERYRR